MQMKDWFRDTYAAVLIVLHKRHVGHYDHYGPLLAGARTRRAELMVGIKSELLTELMQWEAQYK